MAPRRQTRNIGEAPLHFSRGLSSSDDLRCGLYGQLVDALGWDVPPHVVGSEWLTLPTAQINVLGLAMVEKWVIFLFRTWCRYVLIRTDRLSYLLHIVGAQNFRAHLTVHHPPYVLVLASDWLILQGRLCQQWLSTLSRVPKRHSLPSSEEDGREWRSNSPAR